MGYLYLGATIVGFVLLAASLFAGEHGDGGHDVGHAGHDSDHDGSGHGAASIAMRLLSIRFWTYLLAFGGITGLLLRRVAHTGEPGAAIAAALVGVVAAVFARTVLARATRTTESGTIRAGDYVGRVGDVVVPFAKGSTGKIRVRVQGSEVDLLARTEDGAAFERNDEVLVVEVREGSALVTRNPASQQPR